MTIEQTVGSVGSVGSTGSAESTELEELRSAHGVGEYHARSEPLVTPDPAADTALLYQLTRATNAAETLDEVYGPALDAITRAARTDRASILLFDDDGVMRFKAWRHLAEDYRAVVEGHSPWDRTSRDPEPILVADVDRDPTLGDLLPTLRRHGIRALAFFPIIHRHAVLGKFMLYFSETHQYTEHEVNLGTTITGLVGQAVARAQLTLERTRLYEEQRRAREEAESARARADLLAEAGTVLSASLDYETTIRHVAELAVPRIADWCSVTLREGHDGSTYELLAPDDPVMAERLRAHRQRFSREHGVAQRVMERGRPKLVSRLVRAELDAVIPDPARRDSVEAFGIRSLMVVPISAGPNTLGAITFATTTTERTYDAADLEMAVQLGRRVGLAIENARLYRGQRLAREAAESAERALKEADRRKDEFLAVLAHELRNPLAPIRNAIYILRRLGPPEPPLVRARDMIDRQVTHMTHMIDDLLDVTRISRGKVRLQREHVDLCALLGQTVEDHRSLAEGAGLHLELKLPSTPVWVYGDPTRLAQAVGNLLTNASKFTDAGGSIHVTMAIDAGSAWIRVRDTGVGIRPELLSRMFEPFTQDDETLARSRGGLGLGLALVRGLVELHGGHVFAASDGPGLGAELTLQLPRAEASAERAEPSPEPVGRAMRVLVVEDNLDAADSLAELLQLAGHDVAIARDGVSGVERAKAQLPDVVLCDIGLPGELDGYDVARTLRADPELASAHLVALTGYGHEDDRARARAAGFELHLTKPIDPAVVARLLAGYSNC